MLAIAEAFCVIDGARIAEGEEASAGQCGVCSPDDSQTSWSLRKRGMFAEFSLWGGGNSHSEHAFQSETGLR